MIYCKVIQNDKVVSVGHTFLKWDEGWHRFFICDDDNGQCLLSYDEHIYRDSWMKTIPDEAKDYEYATVEVITETEYEDILALLKENEEVPIQPKPTPQQSEIHTEPEQETPMTIPEMREIIKTQQEQIEALMNMVKQ